MADSDPELAAQLLAAFSAPAPTGALPVSDLSSLSYEGWQWASSDSIADLLPEHKSEPQPDLGLGQVLHENIPQEPTPPEPPQQGPAPLQEEPAAQQPLEPQSVEQQPSETSEQWPVQQQSPHQEPSSQAPLYQAALAPSEQEALPPPQQEALPQPTLPHESLPQPPAVLETPPSPKKRSRSRSPEAQNHRGIAEKRLKTDHDELEHRAVDLNAASWDISAMIQNALGSFDEQVNQPPSNEHDGTVHGSVTEPTQARPQAPRKAEQKRMKFSSNPYYVMRTMSLPLLGSLVSQVPPALEHPVQELMRYAYRPFRYCSQYLSSPGKRHWHLWLTRSRNSAKPTIR